MTGWGAEKGQRKPKVLRLKDMRMRLLAMLLAGLYFWGSGVSAQSAVPLITPLHEVVVNEQRCLGEEDTQRCARVLLDLELSGIDWLDIQLLEQLGLVLNENSKTVPIGREAGLARLRQQMQSWLLEREPELQEAIKEGYFVGFEELSELRFLWQRGQLASFRASHYSFSGGAHGMHGTRYLLMDLDRQRWLELDDILLAGHKDALLDALIEAYQTQQPELAQDWLADSRAEQTEQLLLSGTFLLNADGLLFSYGPYILGPYATGQIELQLDTARVRDWLKPGLLPAASMFFE